MNSDFKIALISTFGPPVNGISPYSDNLYKHLLEILPGKISRVGYIQQYPKPFFPAKQLSQTKQQHSLIHWANPFSWFKAARFPAEILHIQYVSPFTSYYLFFISWYAKKNNKKLILTVHNPSSHEYLSLLSVFERKLFLNADSIIVHSQKSSEIFRSSHPKYENKLHIIPHGITLHTTIYEPSNIDYLTTNLSQNNRYILFFGNIRDYKGLDTLIKSWVNISQSFPEFHLIIAGRLWKGDTFFKKITAYLLGTDKVATQLDTALKKHSVSHNIHFLEGFISDDVIDALCRVSSIGVFPYKRFSGQSGAASRAASWGLPIVATNVGGLPDLLIDNKYCVEPNNPQMLETALSDLIRDPELHNNLRKIQTQHCAQFSWAAIAQQHKHIYHMMLNNI